MRHQTETDAVNKAGLPENDAKTTDRPDGPKPEKTQEKRKPEEQEEGSEVSPPADPRIDHLEPEG
jgi:hypothetical protein